MSDKIISIDGTKWFTRTELAERLGVTVRTITNRVNRGEVISKPTAGGGVVYRTADEPGGKEERKGKQTRKPSDAATIGQKESREGKEERKGNQTVELLATANASLATTVDRLTRQLEQQSRQLDEWRTKAEEASHEAVSWRARYHVARGRREMDDGT